MAGRPSVAGVTATMSSRAEKRKQYHEPGNDYNVPRTTALFRRKRRDAAALEESDSATQVVQQHEELDMSQESGEGGLRSDSSGTALDETLGDTGGATNARDEDGNTGDQPHDSHESDSGSVRGSECSSDDDGGSVGDECDKDWQNFLAKYASVIVPNGVLTVAEAIVGIVTYGAMSDLNWSQMEGLLKLANFLVGKNALPETAYLLRKTWSTLKSRMIHHHLFCTVCTTYVGKPQEDLKCPNCGESIRNDFTQGNFFSTVDIKEQMVILLSDKTTAKSLFSALKKERPESTMTDIVDGALYQKGAAAGSWSDLTLTMNTDGARVFNSSKSSLWPLQCVVNELPIALRWSNVLLCGLWFGPGHPDMGMYLEQFVQEVGQVGVITWNCEGQTVHSRVRVVCCCVDAPARAAVLNAKQYNGYFGCSFCLQEGTYLNGSVKYPIAKNLVMPPERTSEGVKQDMVAALQEGTPCHGVKGPTPLMNLPEFDLVWGVNPDYMHCVLEGVVKQLCELWITSTGSEFYVGAPSTLAKIDRRLLQIKPPQWFTRLPRSLLDRQYWKASEWRGWLLHYAVPCLTGILPQRYLDHLCLLVNSVYLLLKDTVANRDIATASDQLTEFVVVMQSLYGAQAMTFNVHQLLHLAKSVHQLGPLWSHSTFIFESGNGQLLKLVSGSNGVPLQILERFVMQQHLKKIMSTVELTQETVTFCTAMAPPQRDMSTHILGSGRLYTAFSESEQVALGDKLGHIPTTAVEYQRISIRGHQYHSASYKRPKKTNNSVFAASDGHHYVLEKIWEVDSGQQLLCCSPLSCHRDPRVDHLFRLSAARRPFRIKLLESSQVTRLCVSMAHARCLSSIPNMFERD